MELFLNILLLIAATITANIIYALFSQIPLAFYQIALGFLLSWLPQFNNFTLNPELFFLLIIAPLMFNEGQNTNYLSLRKNMKSIFSLAIILAILTIVIVGWFLNWVWSALPLALAFCLAAIITPTDAVAVSSITANFEVPPKVMETLETESLFNDASGLVALNLALAAFSTGKFSVISSSENFLVVFVGGVVVGLILGIVLVVVQTFFQRHLFDAAAITLPFNVMAPFLVYLVAEECHLSGILAVVAAGIVHGIYKKRLRLTSTTNQVVLTTTWDILSSLLNGFVFVLLGVTLPRNMIDLAQVSSLHFSVLLWSAVALYIIMILLRFVWAWGRMVKLPAANATERWRNSWVLSLSGVHGTITLAMAFSLPLVVQQHLLPFRTDLIFVAETVIVLSLLVPTFLLPHLLDRQKDAFTIHEFNRVLTQMVDYAINKLRSNDHQNSVALNHVITLLNTQRGHHEHANLRKVAHLFQRTQSLEVAIINDYALNNQVSRENARRYNFKQLANLRRVIANPWLRLKLWWRVIRLIFSKKRKIVWAQRQQQQQPPNADYAKDMQRMENWGYHAVMKYLRRIRTKANRSEIHVVRQYYELRHHRIQQSVTEDENERELLIEAFQYEYYFVQHAVQTERMSPELVSALNEKISTDQFVYMTSDD